MKSIKILFITFSLIFFQNGYSQNENLGPQKRYNFTQQVDNKKVELVFSARPGNFLGGETFFHFKLEKIIIHTWEIDGVFYDSSNSNGVLPASGKLGHAYIDVKTSTVDKNFAHNNYWEKKGFQINKMTDFQDIDYTGKKEDWLTLAYVWSCTIKSVHISDWFQIQKRIKAKPNHNGSYSQNEDKSSNVEIPYTKYATKIVGNWKRIAQLDANNNKVKNCPSSFNFTGSQVTNQYYTGTNCSKSENQSDTYQVTGSNLNIYTTCCGTMTWQMEMPNKNSLRMTFNNVTDVFKRQ